MKTLNLLNNSFRIIILVGAIFFSSCTKDDQVDDKPAPQLPPEGSFAINFDNFKDADTTKYKNSLTYQNWGWAATNIAVWNTALSLTLIVPVAAFYESFNHEGYYYNEDNAWLWTYNFDVGGITHIAKLKAFLVEEGVKWEMYITKNNAYVDFLWYSGISAMDNKSGNWWLNKSPQDPTSFINIEWNKEEANNSVNIKYSNAIPGHVDLGSYIIYGFNNNIELNAFYDIYSTSKDNLTEIQWNRDLKYGRVKDELHFGDPGWHCWDLNLIDVVCE